MNAVDVLGKMFCNRQEQSFYIEIFPYSSVEVLANDYSVRMTNIKENIFMFSLDFELVNNWYVVMNQSALIEISSEENLSLTITNSDRFLKSISRTFYAIDNKAY